MQATFLIRRPLARPAVLAASFCGVCSVLSACGAGQPLPNMPPPEYEDAPPASSPNAGDAGVRVGPGPDAGG